MQQIRQTYLVESDNNQAQQAAHPIDHLITELDKGLRTLFTRPQANRARPDKPRQPGSPDQPVDSASTATQTSSLSETERRKALGLMRINHAGEVAAQALYNGQSLTARDAATRQEMQQAAAEETDHLAWCEDRIRELGGEPSRLGPFWYTGSFALGAAAGLLGDRVSLGFVAETEKQVVAHLENHLQKLPESDTQSRAILEQMRDDEAQHGAHATAAGGVALPLPVRKLMGVASKVMTRTADKF